MSDLRLRHRARLRRKEISELASRIEQYWGLPAPPFREEDAVDEGELEGTKLMLVKNEPLAFLDEGVAAPTVKGLLKWNPTKRFVTVDMGAVPFVTNGADVMTPGIVDADPAVVVGDLVWIREERHGKPLAVGRALMTGPELKASERGKGVKNLHWLGDHLWLLGSVEAATKEPDEEGAGGDSEE